MSYRETIVLFLMLGTKTGMWRRCYVPSSHVVLFVHADDTFLDVVTGLNQVDFSYS